MFFRPRFRSFHNSYKSLMVIYRASAFIPSLLSFSIASSLILSASSVLHKHIFVYGFHQSNYIGNFHRFFEVPQYEGLFLTYLFFLVLPRIFLLYFLSVNDKFHKFVDDNILLIAVRCYKLTALHFHQLSYFSSSDTCIGGGFIYRQTFLFPKWLLFFFSIRSSL